MESFTISFRIADQVVGGKTYADRLEALNTAIKGCVKGKYWDRTTSFYAIQSELPIESIATRCKAAIASSHDLVLILNADVKQGRILGRNDDSDIFTIITYLKSA